MADIENLRAALPFLKHTFQNALPQLQGRTHLNPLFVDARLWAPPPGTDETVVAMLHITVEETLIKPLIQGLRYTVHADGIVRTQRSQPGAVNYWATDAAMVYLPIVQRWVDQAL